LAAIYTGGQVSAKVVLDHKEFDSAIEQVAQRMEDFNKSLNAKGTGDFSEKIASLEKRLKSAETTISSLKDRIEDYKKKLNDLRNNHKRTEEEFKAVTTQSKQYKNQLKDLATQLKDYRANVANANQASAQFKSQVMAVAKAIKNLNTVESQASQYSKARIRNMSMAAKANEEYSNTFQKQQKFIDYIHTGYNKLTGAIVKTTQVLKTFNFALLEGIDKESIFYRRTVQLASAMQRMNSQGTANWAGRGQFGYSQYIAQITKMNEAMTRQRQLEASIKAQRLDKYYAKVGSASAKYWNQIRQGTINLNTYKSQMNQINKALAEQTSRTTQLASAQHRLYNTYHSVNLNSYKANMGEINAALEKQQANFTKTDTNARKAGRGITSFNNGVVQTAHSGRILSNTLYQIRGALLSLKMIFTAMGGMALWGFASSIAEGVKETLSAKNEMEAQLRQNEKVGEGGIAYFNRELEKTTKLFPKINKYSIGETVSSIGLEFNLNAKQMAESLDIVSMVQSEYVRAGRKEAEAALAVKDILQGEFSRLSRETGVGKEELEAYGWNGKKEDVESLMKALRKAAKDRHWDVFAAKATSLNDVMTILRSRFSETGADILNSATPLIVGAFNTLIGAIDKVENAFNGLNSFWQNATLYGGLLSGVLAIGTALPMVTKGMGLADIATIGWGKSLATAALNLNKAEVAQYGFRKALAAVITGTKASELANRRASTAILGRILGVNQAVQAEQGLIGALVHSKMSLKGVNLDAEAGAVIMGNLRQKIIYLAKGEIVADQASATWGKTLKSLITSTKLLRIALFSLMAVNVIVWLANVAAWCDKVKQNVDAFNDVAENGKQLLKDAETTVSDYETALGKLTQGTDEYAQAEANLAQARANRDDIKQAQELVTEYKKQNKETEKAIKLEHQSNLKDSYIRAGKDYKEATEMASGYTEKVKTGQYYINKSLEEYDTRLYRASQHVNEHVDELKAAGASQEDMIRYIDEYNLEAENAAELWKKFNQGDMASGAYAMLSELKLAWIDISHHPEVVKLFQNLSETWKGLQPTLKSITEDLKWLGLRLVDIGNFLMSNDLGRAAVTWGAFGAVVGVVALKIGKWVSGSKSTIGMLKTIGSKLKDRITDWRNYGDEAEKANKKAGGTTSTGGINGDVSKTSGTFKEQLGTQLKADAIKYARAAVAIAAGMLLITEAIVLLRAPMGALAELGWQFKQWEPEIKKGIEGLQLIAPTVIALLIPVTALTLILDKYAPSFTSMVKGGLKAAVGIAMGLLLVTEAIFMLKAPMWAMAEIGKDYAVGKADIENGVTAMKVLADALQYLVPFVPVFAAGIALAAITFAAPEIGIILDVAAVAGIAGGMLLVAEAVVALRVPLEAIRELGNSFTDIEGARKGAEALKVTADAMTYVEQGMRAMAGIQWDLIVYYVGYLAGVAIGVDLTTITSEGGFFDQLNTFIKDFNKLNLEPIDAAKVENLKTASTGMESVGEALKSVKTAMDNLPDEFKNDSNKTANDKYQQAVSGTTTDPQGYFDQFKEPIKQLKSFIDDFNKSEDYAIEPPNQDRITAIQQASSMIGTIKTAVDNVKVAMQGIGDAGWAANMAEGGFGAAVNGWFAGLGGGSGNGGGAGVYSSSLGSSFQQMEDVISDIITFNNNVSTIIGGSTGGDNSGTVDALAGMVTAVDQAIQGLSDTLTNAVPTITGNAKAIGQGLHTGVRDGIGDLSITVKNKVSTAVDAAKPVAYTYGKGLGYQLTKGFDAELKLKEASEAEVKYTFEYLDGQEQNFYDKGAKLGDALSRGYKSKGLQQESPGLMARSTLQEMYYMSDALDEGMAMLPNKSIELGNALSSNFNPQFAVGGLSVDELGQFQMGLDTVSSMATNTDIQTSAAFTDMNTTVGTSMQGMTTSVNGAFTNINQNATTSYAQITNTTRTSLKNMQDQTTRNIQGIKTSWRGMQNALIASAENIRSQTSQKIGQLESNMASFWNKVQNPANLLGAAGSSTMAQHTIRRRSRPRLAAGSSKLAAGKTPNMGISNRFHRQTSRRDSNLNHLAEYIKCLLSDGVCLAGSGWSFNWTPDIQRAFMQWATHFGEIYDKHLRVGKFENDDFPVRGIKDIALAYIEDAIGRTSYEHYFNYKYGSPGNPLPIWQHGSFNCVEGAEVAIGLANAFGFGGGYIGYGTWDGEGHGFAVIPGLGVIDATAIQNGYGLTSPKVRGYPSAGSSRSSGSSKPVEMGKKIEFGDIIVNINGKVDDAKETGREVAEEIIYNVLKRSDATGL